MIFFSVFLLLQQFRSVSAQCRCVPTESCWPSEVIWSAFNTSLSGKLIRTIPPAISCYPGPLENNATCTKVNELWTEASFQAQQPIGYDYPLNRSCPPVEISSGQATGTCAIGNSPVYAVNVTEEQDIIKGLQFAKDNNIRLVVKSTGHDILMRSTGYGSLSLWLYHFRNGFEHIESYQSSDGCTASNWTGSAFAIRGSYAWSDLYPTAAEKKVILVGGNNAGPCSTGGWTQGGGHSPVSHYYGMGADQVLSARVILASGEVVTADACSNTDLFTAIRGGGGGTYGVVTEIVVKVYPTTNVVTQNINIGFPASASVRFLDVMALFYESIPYLSDIGFAGYGSWSINAPAALYQNFTTAYTHSFTLLSHNVSQAVSLFQPVLDKLAKLNTTDMTMSTYQESFDDYGTYFAEKNGTLAPVGGIGVCDNRLLDGPSLTSNTTFLRETLDIIAGTPEEHTYHSISLHGGKVFLDANEPLSGVAPAWRKGYVLDIIARTFPEESNGTAVFEDVRVNKMGAMRALAPNAGSYMNEADWGNKMWKEDFYGSNWNMLSVIKRKYDPEGLFYCQTCVGSDEWEEVSSGALCRVNKTSSC